MSSDDNNSYGITFFFAKAVPFSVKKIFLLFLLFPDASKRMIPSASRFLRAGLMSRIYQKSYYESMIDDRNSHSRGIDTDMTGNTTGKRYIVDRIFRKSGLNHMQPVFGVFLFFKCSCRSDP